MTTHIETNWCKFVTKQVTVKYNRKPTFSGLHLSALRTTMRYCPELGRGSCPVHGIPGHLNYSDCPVFPPSEYFSQA